MEETKNTENFEEVLDENEESKIEEPAKESKFKKAVSKAKDKIKNVKVTTVLKAVAVGAGLVLLLRQYLNMAITNGLYRTILILLKKNHYQTS